MGGGHVAVSCRELISDAACRPCRTTYFAVYILPAHGKHTGTRTRTIHNKGRKYVINSITKRNTRIYHSCRVCVWSYIDVGPLARTSFVRTRFVVGALRCRMRFSCSRRVRTLDNHNLSDAFPATSNGGSRMLRSRSPIKQRIDCSVP
jgi:hypothetical protein